MLHPYTPLGTKFFDVSVRRDDTRNFRSHCPSRNARAATFSRTPRPVTLFVRRSASSSPSPCGHRQRLNALEHRREQAARQVTLGQQEPVVAGMLHQAPAGFDEALLLRPGGGNPVDEKGTRAQVEKLEPLQRVSPGAVQFLEITVARCEPDRLECLAWATPRFSERGRTRLPAARWLHIRWDGSFG